VTNRVADTALPPKAEVVSSNLAGGNGTDHYTD
jgi:hypothetical protein